MPVLLLKAFNQDFNGVGVLVGKEEASLVFTLFDNRVFFDSL
jgi:hypothetical protein